LKLGFVCTISGQQLFVLRRNGAICYLSTHVDDLFVACTKGSKLNDWVREQLYQVFHLTHRPKSSVHLGLVLTCDKPRKSLTISPIAYIDDFSKEIWSYS